MKIKIFFLILLSLLCLNSLTAQKMSRKILIKGTVHDLYRSPIVNAIVMIDGQRTNSLTDSKGNFKVKVRPDASEIGIFTFGNGVLEEAINGRTLININFKTMSTVVQGFNNAAGEEAVNVGYGYVKKKNITNDINKISGTHKDYSSYSSIYEMIQREVPGVRISGTSISIHGPSNFSGPVEPLFVVDGVYVKSIDDIKPATVESIEVLKDASAGIYGSRALGGAIIIKTKTQNLN